MLLFNLPKEDEPGFMRGKSAMVRINGVARRLTFDAVAQTVNFTDDKGPQVRKFIASSRDGNLVRFACAGADGIGVVFAPNAAGGITANT